ncbi:1,4-dihydroxy-2-naphthoate polyprenyltransferase [Bacillus sonorensis]|uniref:1,4-dihydroxy-2-naphthoate octaprenyltransferase n=2 Tax=Bacillus sonorensis TaxID=119858 RepID=M5PAP5_9BACI|nr:MULTISPECIES: 1,4-dihydroxy-2-naphthoate polyprenyltransferase [Bacillus]TWK74077.1 1,4-dihydroxy-2-naphthoate octaprenyltransferase [Bacillus paralicheniformis]ASB87777.1 1,4-dihydroxy-2-naphthoate octaprenyltransferase [Bacillus sonorensis]EME76629.1 1,4-dihydroxy-2-naphthoate octaprenyltransferase [Bacillus sonorensis L12]MBG9915696.1 1,4-dihydroxy-2-naphthoate octaprenyltransferase [Bacillus sonorensis]MCF7617113.1 1,4-dihydroxy-2-naphthoate polyprenyltransferase [Bacillus sonorensis]
MQHQSLSGSVSGIKPDKSWRVWWMLTRPHTLTAAFVPVTLGTVLALETGRIDIWLFLAMLVASILIQIGTNLFNEYFDFVRGLDNENSVGIGGAIVRYGMKPKTVLYLAYGLFAAAVLLGIYICISSSWWLALIGLICMAVGYLYTGGPLPISYTPFGEIMSGVFMGMIIILISYFLQTGELTWSVFLVSLPITILVGGINLSNNIRDLVGDKENGRKTLPILAGRKNAVQILSWVFIVSYVLIGLYVALGILTVWSFLVLLSLPKPIKAIKEFKAKEKPADLMVAMKSTAQTNTFFGLLLALALVIHYFV